MLKTEKWLSADDGGGGGEPAPAITPAPPTIEGETTKLLVEQGETLKQLKAELRGLQGRQDKGDNALKDFQTKQAEYDRLIKKGYEPQDAYAEMGKVDADSQWRTSLQQQIADLTKIVQSGGNAQSGQQQVVKVFETIGLDLKDPRVAVALTKSYDSPELMELEAYRLQRQISLAPNPNKAQDPSMNGTKGSSSTHAELVVQMDKALESGDFKAIQELNEKLKVAGVPGW